MSSFSESSTSAQTKKSFLGLSQDMTVLIGGVGGAFLVIIIAIIGICCIVRKIHKNSSPPNTPAHSRPTSQQEPAEMTSVREKLYLSLTVMLSIQWSRVFSTALASSYTLKSVYHYKAQPYPQALSFPLQKPGVGFFRIRCEGLSLEMYALILCQGLIYLISDDD